MNFKVGVEITEKGAGKTVSELKKFDGTLNDVVDGAKGKLSSVGSIAEEVGAKIPIPFAAAAATIVGLGAAAVGVGKVLFDLTKSASDFGSEIKDASDKTGLSAETLSSLKVAADQSGSSLDQVASSVSKFSKLVGSAAEGSKEARQTLLQLGLDPQAALKDLEGSLAVVFKRIADAQNPIIATKLATDAFGKSGADLIPVIKSFDGNTAELIKRMKELGLTIDNDAMNQADEFGDQMDTVKAQVSGLTRQIGFGLMPKFLELGRTISAFLAEHKDGLTTMIGGLVSGLSTLVDWIGKAIKGYRLFGSVLADVANKDYTFTNWRVTNTQIDQEEAQARQQQQMLPQKQTGPGLVDQQAVKDQQEAIRKTLETYSNANDLEIARQRQNYEKDQQAWKDALDAKTLTFEQYKQGILYNMEQFAGNIRQLLAQGFQIDSQGKTGLELENARKAYQNGLDAFNNEIAKQKADLTKQETEAEKKAAEEGLKIRQDTISRDIELSRANTELRIAQIEEGGRRQNQVYKAIADENRKITDQQYAFASKTESELIKQMGEAKTEQLRLEKSKNEELLKDTRLTAEQRAEIEQKIKLLDIEIAKQEIENRRAVDEAVRKEMESWLDLRDAMEIVEDQAQRLSVTVDDLIKGDDPGSDPKADRFARLKGSWEDFVHSIEGSVGITNIIDTISDAAQDAMLSMVDAVGQAVEAWALYGDSIGEALKKALAAELAHIAGIATVNAMYATALGFLRLAQWDFAAAGQAFISAGIWAAIAGGTALAAKAISGSGNDQQGSGGNQPDYYTSSPQNSISTTAPNAAADARTDKLAAAIEDLHGKISGMRPGDVLTAGAKEKKGFIADQTISDLRSNGSKATQMGKALRLA